MDKPISDKFPPSTYEDEQVLREFFNDKNPNLLTADQRCEEVRDLINSDCRGLALLRQKGEFIPIFNSYAIQTAAGPSKEWNKDHQAKIEDEIRLKWLKEDYEELNLVKDGDSLIIYMFPDDNSWQVIATKMEGEWWFPFLNF